MISEDAVGKAVDSAEHELAKNPDMSWITKSALTERAYYVGLFNGLSGIADEELINGHIVKLVMGTMWQREADDTFPSTKIGQNYQKLMNKINSRQPVDDEFKQVLKSLEHYIESNNRKWQGVMREVQGLMERVSDIVVALENNTVVAASNHDYKNWYELRELFLGHLGTLARQVALIEIDHNLQNRFEA